MSTPVAGEVIATIRSYPDLVEAFRTIKARLGLSNKWCDDACGYADGVTDKKIGPSHSKNINDLDFSMFCHIFAVELTMTIDMDQVRKMETAWEQREAGKVSVQKTRMGKELLERAKPIIYRENARKGGARSRANMPAVLASKIGRKAGKSRMRKLSRKERIALAKLAADARWRRQRARQHHPIPSA